MPQLPSVMTPGDITNKRGVSLASRNNQGVDGTSPDAVPAVIVRQRHLGQGNLSRYGRRERMRLTMQVTVRPHDAELAASLSHPQAASPPQPWGELSRATKGLVQRTWVETLHETSRDDAASSWPCPWSWPLGSNIFVCTYVLYFSRLMLEE